MSTRYVLGAGAGRGVKCFDVLMERSFQYVFFTRARATGRGEGGAGRRGVLVSWEEVPPHLEFGETMTGGGKRPIAPFAALEGGYAHRLTKDPRDMEIWQTLDS